MADRRKVIKLTLTGVAALALDPTGLLRRPEASALAVDAEEWEGFLIVRPGSTRPRKDPPKVQKGVPLAFEGPGSRGATIDIPEEDAPRSLLATTPLRAPFARPLAQRRLTVGGETVQETRVFEHDARGWTILSHANPNTGNPYVLMPIGTPQDGFYEWNRGTFLGRRVIGAAPATSLVAMWMDGETLRRVEVHTQGLLGPSSFAGVLHEIESNAIL